jgi:4-aminobutyrate aminotransferase-like enzyme
MTGGFPLSAAIATPQVLRHWPLNTAEAIHTSTFLGNPMGCAVGLKAMEILERDQLAQRAAKLGDWLLSELRRIAQARRDIIYDVRGKGFMIGIEFADKDGTPRTDLALKIVDEMRDHGFMLLPSGPWSQVVSLSPPLMMPKACLEAFLEVFETCVLKIRA